MNNGIQGFEWDGRMTMVKKQTNKKKLTNQPANKQKSFRVIPMTDDGGLIQDTGSEDEKLKNTISHN